MKYEYVQNIVKGACIALLAAAVTAGSSSAATYDLCASDGTVTINGVVIPIWGYVDITGGGACTPGLATIPGPELTDIDGATLTVNLSNALPVPVSIFIPGLAKISADPLVPQTTSDGLGRERLTSFDETVLPGGTLSYSWATREGTFLYESGSDVRTQVPMGMYGALAITGTGYPAVADETVVLFSEIDPVLNADPANFGGARVSNWNPQYFLINGEAYDPANPPIDITVSQDVLLRFVNAGLETFVPTFGGGIFMDVIAEDGNLYPYPLTQYGLELQAGKTYDAVINAGAVGTYMLYDRALHLNGGGQVVKFQAGAAAGAPTAVSDLYSVVEDNVLTADGLALNPAGVLNNDVAGTGPGPLAVSLVSDVSNGVLALNGDGTFTYTPTPDFSGSDMFTYVANDGGPVSNVAAAAITVTPVNDGPVAVVDSYSFEEGMTLNVVAPGVLGNDTDPDGDVLSATVSGTIPAGLTLNSDGSFNLDATGFTAGASVLFNYTACDAEPLCSVATVTINVLASPANVAPIANDDFAETPRNTTITVTVTANDEDPDGTINPTTVVVTTGTVSQRGGIVVNNSDGTITYTPPNPGFRGTDTFQYIVNDNNGEVSNVATVHINVVR